MLSWLDCLCPVVLHANSSHHARGPEVEYVYPPLSETAITETQILPSSSTASPKTTKSSPTPVPPSWHLVPFMALPDGAHMVAEFPFALLTLRVKRTIHISHFVI